MSGDARVTVAVVYGFLLVLTRISFAFIFVPMPGLKSAPDPSRILISVCLAVCLYPLWPRVTADQLGTGELIRLLLIEAAFGLTVGLAVGFLSEAFVLAAQIIGFQAGYSYASAVDPATQSDSTVLQTAAQLCAGFLFFVLGLHREVLRVFAWSLEVWPPGSFTITEGIATAIRNLGAAMLSTGLRLALPVLALTILIDISLALLGRINAQLQLLTLAFPLKMLAALAMFAAVMSVFPFVFERAAHQSLATVARMLR